ncbi:site-specific DNA-methyltransferase [Loigolactobacillus coryniformis]|jgi:DNA modification methylase|uniref:Methyltransferase n=3 Tax=Loigolactobacillus TaxID=2767889 RepID=J3JBU3_9LACO|nr:MULTISPECIES: site-specific DNA-methyltransferase [Lactobacillaceae]MCI1911135.1 site-specific DNA-methyltransferase [Lactobacillus amylovorus]MCI2020531.1 site-specific DNA-methyltransferase [Lentilactobacillus buchneri]OEH89919.1 DNA methyltransferase [Loigolactobacillus coryniformis subsp. coryniformis]ATO54797.1 site-specific DNA-methyltransferase [Loigolactobacillus coryniformis subsp. coryniformis KCTC 3167 = DSM 20001]EJN56022.1 DNA methylase family protein [Loigolactobacillus coryni
MKKLPDQSVDLILCDLPYGTTPNTWDSIIPFEQLWQQYLRLIKPRSAIVLTSNQRFSFQLYNSQPELFRYKWVWVKSNVTNFINAHHRPMSRYEEVLVFSKAPVANSDNAMFYYPQDLMPMNKTITNAQTKGFGNQVHPWAAPEQYVQEYQNYPNDILRFKADKNIWHPTQKPVALFEYLIKTYTLPGQVVLDNCMGSATTAIACINTDRHYIGYELDPNYYQKALARIKQHHSSQTSLW